MPITERELSTIIAVLKDSSTLTVCSDELLRSVQSVHDEYLHEVAQRAREGGRERRKLQRLALSAARRFVTLPLADPRGRRLQLRIAISATQALFVSLKDEVTEEHAAKIVAIVASL
ncbi:MAG: hypothetical protein MHM6MM_004468 [Cercozoa sp. M6MM]